MQNSKDVNSRVQSSYENFLPWKMLLENAICKLNIEVLYDVRRGFG